MRPSNYPPGVTGNEPQITGEDEHLEAQYEDQHGDLPDDVPDWWDAEQDNEATLDEAWGES